MREELGLAYIQAGQYSAALLICYDVGQAINGNLGDRFGAAADSKITRFLKECLADLGYEVQMNRPYAGGYITEHYGRPPPNVPAVQFELNRCLYLDWRPPAPSAALGSLQRPL